MVKTNKILCGDALEMIKTLPSESVNCVVTSPPYWGLRDYGVDGQIGLEKDFNDYIHKLCEIFDEVKRVLRNDGTCWVNLGDTYAGTKVGNTKTNKNKRLVSDGFRKQTRGVSDKCLLQIPSRFAIEMCNRGWILRNKIIWHKPNVMPQSVKDRFTVDFEEVFFFVKSKKYWFEQQLEPYETTPTENNRKRNKATEKYEGTKLFSEGERDYYSQGGRNKRTVWSITTKPYKEAHFATYPEELISTMIKAGCPVGGVVLDPFGGSGTTAQAAIKQDKKYIVIELNQEYIPLIQQRIDKLTTQIKLF